MIHFSYWPFSAWRRLPPLLEKETHLLCFPLPDLKAAYSPRTRWLQALLKKGGPVPQLKGDSARLLATPLLHRLLQHYCPHFLPAYLAKTPKGKPFLLQSTSAAPLHFNLSHSKNVLLYVFSKSSPVGIDLEFFEVRRTVAAFKKIACRFAAADLPALSSAPLAFLRAWVMKEAFAKLKGESVFYALPLPLSQLKKSYFFNSFSLSFSLTLPSQAAASQNALFLGCLASDTPLTRWRAYVL